MSDNKKYFYLKFKENYFDQDHIKVIESMKNGFEYSLILLKLYLKSLKYEGQLMINERIPYMSDKIDLLAGVLGHDPANVMHAINLAKDLEIMEILTTGEMFMSDIQNFIGHSSSEAERKAKYRERINSKSDKKAIEYKKDKNGTMSQNIPPELELELELDKELNINKDKEKKISYMDNVKMTESQYNKLVNIYGDQQAVSMIRFLSDYKIEKNYKTKCDYRTILRWVVEAVKATKLSQEDKQLQSLPEVETKNTYLEDFQNSQPGAQNG